MSDTVGNTPADTQVIGRCKWFNNKAGYGFVTVVLPKDHPNVNSDIFVHHSGVKVANEQYRYLVQGEYVGFTLQHMDEGEHEWQATDITGVGGGMLMCETRNEARQNREGDDDDERPERSTRNRRQTGGQRVRLHGEGVRDGEVWTLVKEDRRPKNTRRQAHRRVRNEDEQ
jgi:cold shock CspA family protein